MSYFTLPQLKAGLKIVEQYTSYKFRAQVFFENGLLTVYLPKGKTPSNKAVKQLENVGWYYDAELHRISFQTPDVNELLTHENKNIREQAARHMKCVQDSK